MPISDVNELEPVDSLDEFEETERNMGGFGSSGI
jgi:dUTPase